MERFEVNTIGVVEFKGKKYYVVNGRLIPEDCGWFAVIMALIEKGYRARIHYPGEREVYEVPVKWEFDREGRGLVPVVPEKVEFFEEVEPEDELLKLMGKKRLKKVLEISGRSLIDPDPIESMEMISLTLKFHKQNL